MSVAQENYQVTSYGVDEGLPQSSIWDIMQDRNGFLWVSTSDGLCRFDGYNFTVYKNNPKDSSSVCGNRDHRFYVDKKGNLWIVCWNGICLYNDQKDNFSPIFKYEPPLRSDNFNIILGEDDQYIWAGLSNYGIVKVNKQTHRVTGITNVGGTDLSTFEIWSGGFIENNNVYIGNRSGFFIYSVADNKIAKIGDSWFASFINLNDSEALAGGNQRLALLNKKTRAFTYLPVDLFKNSAEVIADILPETGDQVILACHRGLFYYNIRTGKIIKSIRSFDTEQKNKYAFAQCLYHDRSNNLWIGTNGDGLKKINYPYKKFLSYNSHSNVSNLVKAIYADSARVYVGYFSNGMDIFNRVTGFEKNISFAQNANDNRNHVYAVAGLSARSLVLDLASENRMCIFDVVTGNITRLPALLEKAVAPNKPDQTRYPFLYKENDGTLLTVFGEYLIALNRNDNGTVRSSSIHRFDGETLCCVYEDSNNVLWVGTMNCVYRRSNNNWTRVGLPENMQVKSINMDLTGNLWLGTVKGIVVLDAGGKVINYFSEANGLTNQFVYGILRDNDGDMWFSHNKGLSVYHVKTKEFHHYYKEDGLQSSEFNTNSYYKSKDGMLFFGGINGVNAFYPSEILDNPHIPEVRITSIKLFDLPLITDSACWNVHTLTLPYNNNSLSFEFAGLEYTNPKKNQYAYMMEGLDNTWINSGDRRFARYSAMPAGEYVFKVKASNNDGKWQENPAIIYISIVPPFWQQLWFRVLVILILGGSIAGIILWIQRQQHRREIRALELQQKIQLERERISRDLHDTVGTQLSLISNNIEWVAHPLKVISEREKTDKLHFVNNTARDIIATLRETIWALNKQRISYEEFSDKLKSFVHRQLAIYPQIQLNYNEQLGEGIVLGPSEALNLFRICQEAVANSLKYAQATAIDIELRNNEGKYRVSITDNGIGFDVDGVDHALHNGLENMRFRAQDIGCEIEINSEPGKGTSLVLAKNKASAVLRGQ